MEACHECIDASVRPWSSLYRGISAVGWRNYQRPLWNFDYWNDRCGSEPEALAEGQFMHIARKLKPDRSLSILYPAFFTLALFCAVMVLGGLKPALFAIALCFLLYALYSFISSLKTGNVAYALAGLYQIFFGIACISMSKNDSRLAKLFFACAIFLGLYLVYMAAQKKLKWRGREILELAAEPVTESNNGFTSRPLASIKTEYSKNTILDFARFLSKNLIALAYCEKDRVVFVPVMMGEEYRHVLGIHPNDENSTWISLDYGGKVTVSIAQKDYLRYKENLTFNELCESLGRLFVEFLELYSKGEGARIIDRMDNLRMSVFS